MNQRFQSKDSAALHRPDFFQERSKTLVQDAFFFLSVIDPKRTKC